MIAFLIAALALLGTAVYFVHLLLLGFFLAEKTNGLIILLALIGSCLGFIISLFLVRAHDSLVVRLFYILFSLAMGLLFYLTIFAIFYQSSKIIKFSLSNNILARIGVALAVILFVVGLFEAGISKVKDISVNMAGLPTNWQGKKIVQISDIHLGGIYGLGFLRRQVAKVNALNPDLIVITGDLFDGSEGNLTGVSPELAKLKASNGVIFITGNHDTYLGLDKVEPILKNAGIIVLRDEAINLNGLEVIGLDFAKFSGDTNARNIKNLDPNFKGARVLLNHVPTDIAFAKSLNVDLQLSGHSHRGQMFPLSLMTQLIYGKYQYGLHTEGAYNIYTSSGLGSWGPPVRTFNQAEIVNITLK